MSKRIPKKGKKVVKSPKNDSRRGKLLYQIRTICKKHPKIKKKIKNIKDIDKKLYYAKVWYITENQPLHILEHSDKRGWKDHHLDHIYPISMGYVNKIPPEKIGNIKNLQFIHHEENISKGSTITEESKNALRRIRRLK